MGGWLALAPPSITWLFRVHADRLPPNIVDRFPTLIQEVLDWNKLGEKLRLLLVHMQELHPVCTPEDAEQAVTPQQGAPSYSMALSNALAKLVVPCLKHEIVGELTHITVNLQQMGDPMLAALVHALCVGYPGVAACIAAGVPLSEEDIEVSAGLLIWQSP